MIKYSRRRWLRHSGMIAIAGATVGGSNVCLGPLLADPPNPNRADDLRIAASQLPITSQSVRLKNRRETRVVVTAITADPRGELLVAAGDDHLIRILQASTLQTLQTLSGHRDLIRTLAFDSTGDQLVSAGNDGQVIVWDRESGFAVKDQWSGQPALASVCFDPVGQQIAAVGFNNQVHLIGNHAEQPTCNCECRDLRAVAYRHDGQLMAVAGRSGDLHLFGPEASELISDHALHGGRIHDLAFLGESARVICVGEDGTVTVFDTESNKLTHRIAVTSGKLFAVAVLNEQLVAVAGSDNLVRIIDINRGLVVRALPGHHGSVATLDSAGGWLFSGSYDATIRRWAVADISTSEQRIAEGDQRIDR